jgi:hypothetical protein
MDAMWADTHEAYYWRSTSVRVREISGIPGPFFWGYWRWYPGKIQPPFTCNPSAFLSTLPSSSQLFTPPEFYAALNKVSFKGQATS